MSDLTEFQGFIKKNIFQNLRENSNACVIYTRVSTKLQVNEDGSLDTQEKACRSYAKTNKLKIAKFFGGSNESANSDDRKEFNKMLSYVQSNTTIKYILVYKITRFSRTGESAINLIDKLKKKGVYVISVTEPGDSSTTAGTLMQNIHAALGKYENEYRRDYLMDGIRKKLLEGYTMKKPPIGYTRNRVKDRQVIKINETGELIRKAFLMKLNEGLSSVEIVSRLKNLGVNMTEKKLSKIFRNPYYAGIIVDARIDRPTKGRHPAIIEPQLFLKLKNSYEGKEKNLAKKDKEHLPLKHHIKCHNCNKPFTGYDATKKKTSYYKCQTGNCRVNRSNIQMHIQYTDLLKKYMILEKYKEPLKAQLIRAFEYHNKQNKENKIMFKNQLENLEKEITQTKRSFAVKLIDKTIYEDVMAQLQDEKANLVNILGSTVAYLDSIDDFIDFTMDLAVRLDVTWNDAKLEEKIILQDLIFPEGVFYEKGLNNYRTIRVNDVFNFLVGLQRDWENGHQNDNPQNPLICNTNSETNYRTFQNAGPIDVNACYTSATEQSKGIKKGDLCKDSPLVLNTIQISNSNIIGDLIKIKAYKEYVDYRAPKKEVKKR